MLTRTTFPLSTAVIVWVMAI